MAMEGRDVISVCCMKNDAGNAMFIIRQVQEKHQAKKKKLYYAFVDLEKAFDRVPREFMKAAAGFGSRWMTDLMNNIVKEGCMRMSGSSTQLWHCIHRIAL